LAKVPVKRSCKSASMAHFLDSKLKSLGRSSAIFRCCAWAYIDQITPAHPNFARSFADLTLRNVTSPLRKKVGASRKASYCYICIIHEIHRKYAYQADPRSRSLDTKPFDRIVLVFG